MRIWTVHGYFTITNRSLLSFKQSETMKRKLISSLIAEHYVTFVFNGFCKIIINKFYFNFCFTVLKADQSPSLAGSCHSDFLLSQCRLWRADRHVQLQPSTQQLSPRRHYGLPDQLWNIHLCQYCYLQHSWIQGLF